MYYVEIFKGYGEKAVLNVICQSVGSSSSLILFPVISMTVIIPIQNIRNQAKPKCNGWKTTFNSPGHKVHFDIAIYEL